MFTRGLTSRIIFRDHFKSSGGNIVSDPLYEGERQAYAERITVSHRKIAYIAASHRGCVKGQSPSTGLQLTTIVISILPAVFLTRAASRVMGITCHVHTVIQVIMKKKIMNKDLGLYT